MIRFTGADRKIAARGGGVRRRAAARALRGATLMVAAIGIFAVGVALVVAVPLVQKSDRNERAAATVRQIREFQAAFQAYATKHGEWPAATNATGQKPPGMEASLPATWSRRTPLGGRYLWGPDAVQSGHRYRATILFWPRDRESVTQDRQLLEEIDRALDDGDLHSGNFQLGYRDLPFFVLEP